MNDLDPRLSEAHEAFHRDHDRQRDELLQRLGTDSEHGVAAPQPGPRRWASRWRLVAAAAGVLLAVSIWSSLGSEAGAVPWTQVSEQLGKIRSATFVVTSTVERAGKSQTDRSINSFLAPRHLHQGPPADSPDFGQRHVVLQPLDDPTIDAVVIDHAGRRLLIERAFPESVDRPTLLQPERLWQTLQALPDEAIRDIGVGELDGEIHQRYVTSVRSVEPRSRFDGELRIWIDPATHLPARIEADAEKEGIVMRMAVSELRYDVEVDRTLFQLPTDLSDWIIDERWTVHGVDSEAPPAMTLTRGDERLLVRSDDWTVVHEPGESYFLLQGGLAEEFGAFCEPRGEVTVEVLGRARTFELRGTVAAPAAVLQSVR